MSCGGNTFKCGIGRFNKFNIADKPSNQQLYNENESKLSALLRLRDEQDKGVFNTPINNSINNTNIVNITDKLDINKADINKAYTIYTPFKYKY